ncbi:MAG: K+/H+ antiporter subunit F [Rhodobacteraceae bacterium]|nr:K+/H+ antiporter subunit F [Paracoccaceae bacterium]
MLTYALSFAFGCFGLSILLNLVRLLRGPAPADRILAVDTMVVNVVALIVLYGIATGNPIHFEAAILFAMTGFLSTVALSKYLLRGDIIE